MLRKARDEQPWLVGGRTMPLVAAEYVTGLHLVVRPETQGMGAARKEPKERPGREHMRGVGPRGQRRQIHILGLVLRKVRGHAFSRTCRHRAHSTWQRRVTTSQRQ